VGPWLFLTQMQLSLPLHYQVYRAAVENVTYVSGKTCTNLGWEQSPSPAFPDAPFSHGGVMGSGLHAWFKLDRAFLSSQLLLGRVLPASRGSQTPLSPLMRSQGAVHPLVLELFFFFVVLRFELRAFTLSHSTNPILVKGFFEIGSRGLFPQAGFEPQSS
jgi:hypothetical protein